MTKARNLSLLSTVEAGATADQTKADLNAIGVSGGRKNLIINGGMQVAQRGTSTTGNSNAVGFYACDRVKLFNINAGPTYTVTQDTSAPAGFVNSFKVQCTTADTSLPADHYTILRTGLIECSDMVQAQFGASSAKSLTYSFWVKSNKTGNQLVMFVDHKNQKEIGQVFNIAVADTWEKKVITVIGNTGSSFDNSSSSGLTVDFYLAVGTNRSGGSTPTAWGNRVTINAGATNLSIADSTANYFQITGVQLELGSVATDFEHATSYGETLALCQRYYYKEKARSAYKVFTSGYVGGSTVAYSHFTFPQTMRGTPTISYGGAFQVIDGSAYVVTSMSFDHPTQDGSRVDVVSSGMTAKAGMLLRAANDINAFIAADAEL